MQEPGYIDAMVNPSLEGLVKIGKTTRDPESRAQELSQATGVATPFYVVFHVHVPDCHSAEQFVHSVLEFNGLRHTPNREFFQVSVKQAVEVLLLAEKEFQRPNALGRDAEVSALAKQALDSSDEGHSTAEEHPGKAVYKQAIDTYYGFGEELKDANEAIRLLHSAKAMNFPAAFTTLAHYFLEQMDDGACQTEEQYAAHRDSAIAVLKEGASKGHGRCWVALAGLFADSLVAAYTHSKPDLESAGKCWKRYFQSETFRLDDDEQRTLNCDIGMATMDLFPCGRPRASYCADFLKQVAHGSLALDADFRSLLQPIKDEILNSLASAAAYGSADYAQESRELAEFVKQTL